MQRLFHKVTNDENENEIETNGLPRIPRPTLTGMRTFIRGGATDARESVLMSANATTVVNEQKINFQHQLCLEVVSLSRQFGFMAMVEDGGLFYRHRKRC